MGKRGAPVGHGRAVWSNRSRNHRPEPALSPRIALGLHAGDGCCALGFVRPGRAPRPDGAAAGGRDRAGRRTPRRTRRAPAAASGMGTSSSSSASMTPASASSSASVRGRRRAAGRTPRRTPSRWTMAMIATHSSSLIDSPIPSQSLILRVVVVDRGEDDVHVQERRDRQRRRTPPASARDRGQDRREREEREQVALVDARRHDEEHEREHGERRRAACVGPAGARR